MRTWLVRPKSDEYRKDYLGFKTTTCFAYLILFLIHLFNKNHRKGSSYLELMTVIFVFNFQSYCLSGVNIFVRDIMSHIIFFN